MTFDRYIQENYSKIRDVEKELENLNLEVKLTAGPKKAGKLTFLLKNTDGLAFVPRIRPLG